VSRDRECTHVTPRNLHGKEGVDGSSPSEACRKALQMGNIVLPAPTNY
jgi:hypothetical protein